MKEGVEARPGLELATVNHMFHWDSTVPTTSVNPQQRNETMRAVTSWTLAHASQQVHPERTPAESVRGTGGQTDDEAIQQFGEDSIYPSFRKAFDQSGPDKIACIIATLNSSGIDP